MKPIQDLLNKIKWEKYIPKENYVLYYYDRVEKTLKSLKITEIDKIEDGFLVINLSGREINIPLHRIRKVEENGEVIWERK